MKAAANVHVHRESVYSQPCISAYNHFQQNFQDRPDNR